MKTWQRVVAYVAFSIFALVVSFFLTFPYDAIKDRVRMEAESAGYFVRIGSMGPGFFTVRSTDIELSKKAAAGEEKPPEPLRIDSVSVGPTLFPPGLSVSAKLMGGAASVRVSGISNVSVRAELDGLDLSKGNVKGFSGIDLAGEIDAEVRLDIPKASVGGGPSEPDFGAANGLVSLDARGVTVNGGTLALTIPMYGPEPTPLDLPKIGFGDLNGKLTIEKGAGKLEDLHGKSADLEISASGTLKLAKRLEYSEPNIEVRFKAEPEFVKRLGLIGSALSVVMPDPKDPNFRMGRLTGYLGRPNFR